MSISHSLRDRQPSLFATVGASTLALGGGIIHSSCNQLTAHIESAEAGAGRDLTGHGSTLR